MDTLELVESQAASRAVGLSLQLVRDGFEITAAFWVRTTEADDWSFYIATPLIEQKRSARSISSFASLSPTFRGNPFVSLRRCACWVSKIRSPKMCWRFSLTTQAVCQNDTLGDGSAECQFDGAYIYPPHLYTLPPAGQTAKDEVLRELFQLMNRGPDDLLPSRVTMKAGDSFEGVPYSIQRAPQGAVVVVFIDKTEPVPRIVNVDDIDSVS